MFDDQKVNHPKEVDAMVYYHLKFRVGWRRKVVSQNLRSFFCYVNSMLYGRYIQSSILTIYLYYSRGEPNPTNTSGGGTTLCAVPCPLWHVHIVTCWLSHLLVVGDICLYFCVNQLFLLNPEFLRVKYLGCASPSFFCWFINLNQNLINIFSSLGILGWNHSKTEVICTHQVSYHKSAALCIQSPVFSCWSHQLSMCSYDSSMLFPFKSHSSPKSPFFGRSSTSISGLFVPL